MPGMHNQIMAPCDLLLLALDTQFCYGHVVFGFCSEAKLRNARQRLEVNGEDCSVGCLAIEGPVHCRFLRFPERLGGQGRRGSRAV